MGVKLAGFFQEATKVGGLMARVKMAMLTKLSFDKASAAPDSPENIKLFESALATIKAGA